MNSDLLKTSNYEYDLPQDCIAQTPLQTRENSKLLVQTEGREIRDLYFHDLPDLLIKKDLLVVNKSRVQKARLNLRKKTGGQVEVLALQPIPNVGEQNIWEALIKPARRVKPGAVLYFEDEPVLEITHRVEDTARHYICPTGKYFDMTQLLDELGTIPLPPYITTPLENPERYQTIFSKSANSEMDSVAAPTAGLHLSQSLCEKITARGIQIVELELAVGLATFTPIKTEEISAHNMHTERYQIPAQTYKACLETKQAGGRVIAVGTTVVRALETAALSITESDFKNKNIEAESQLFIQPDFQFQMIDALVTNFHLPKSTLLVLLASFIGDSWKSLYEHALKNDYRFLSFGDAMFVSRQLD